MKFHQSKAELGPRSDKKLLYFTFDLKLWPWPLSYRPGSCMRHAISSRWTFVPGNMKIHWSIVELEPGQDKKSQILTFDLKLWPWPLSYRPGSCTRHAISSRRIFVPGYMKIHQSIVELEPGQDKKSQILTFDLRLWPWPLSYRPGSCTRHTLSSRRILVVSFIKFHWCIKELEPGQARTDARTDAWTH